MGIVCNCFSQNQELIMTNRSENDNKIWSVNTLPKIKIYEEESPIPLMTFSNTIEPIDNKLDSIELNKNFFESINEKAPIDKKYVKIRLISKTECVEVWHVRNKIINEYCAMKIIERKKENNEDSNIENEINILKGFLRSGNDAHPSVVKIFDIFTSPEEFYIITEYCPGGNLLEELIKRGKPLSEAECAPILSQVLNTLRYFHRMGIIHRDIKPENIMIVNREENGNMQIKVMDCCITAIYSSKEINNPYFIAPEILNENKYDYRYDLWSLGVTMYFLLTGCMPFQPNGKSIEILKKVKNGNYDKQCYQYKRLSSPAKNLIDKLLTIEPEKRISLKDAFSHEWFLSSKIKVNINSNIDRLNMIKQLINNILTYPIKEKLKCASIAFLIQNNYNLELCLLAEKLFKNVDLNHDDKINLEELGIGLEKFLGLKGREKEIKAKEIFINLDPENNNYIEYKEFIRASVNPNNFLYDNYLKYIYNSLERDYYGNIYLNEIENQLVEYYIDDNKIIHEQLKTIIQKINFNEKEAITLKIFSQLMKSILMST